MAALTSVAAIEPVGAFVYHLPDDERKQWEADHG